MDTPRLHLIRKGSLLRYRWFASSRQAPMEFRRELGGQGSLELQTLVARVYKLSTEPHYQDEAGLVALGRALYQLLIPEDFRLLLQQNKKGLAVHGGDPLFPWEVLHDGEQFLGLRFPIGRLPGWFEPNTITSEEPKGYSTEQVRVVLVSDPLNDLPDAQREIEYLTDSIPTRQPKLMMQAGEVTPSAFARALNEKEQAVLLHVAAKAAFEPIYGTQILLGESSLNRNHFRIASSRSLWAFLHLSQDEQAIQQTPSMVVSLASSLLEEGAQGIVASLRSDFTSGCRQIVGDYYRNIFEGHLPAEALMLARQRFALRNPDDPSWSSFVFFGDPGTPLLACSAEESKPKARRTMEPAGTGWSSPAMESAAITAGVPDAKSTVEPSLSSDASLEYDFDLEQAIGIALMEAKNLRQDFIGTPHLFIGLTKCPGGVTRALLESSGFDPKKVRDTIRYALGFGHASLDAKILPTQRCARALKSAEMNARKDENSLVREQHLLSAILESGEGLAFEVLKKMGADPQKLHQKLLKGEIPEAQNRAGGDTPTLDRYGRDLTELAAQGKLPHLTGRSKELSRLSQILLRRFKNNPLITGEAGVGKTALVEGLAQRIVAGAVPEGLRNRRLIELSLSGLVAGTRYRGDFEERLTQVIREVREHPEIILFLDEFHTVVGAGETHQGTLDAANILKPALARGELRCIGATTPIEYRKHIEKDAALERRFHPLFVEEPSVEEAMEIVQGAKLGYEEHHKVEIPREVLALAVELAVRYLPDRRLPDKALDLIDEACALVTLRGHSGSILSPDGRIRVQSEKPVVSVSTIHSVLADWTGIPVGEISKEEGRRLLELPKHLTKRVLGQPIAVTSVSEAVQLGRAGLKRENCPTAVFLFVGPSGVGKTELCRALAEQLFGDESALIRLDMSEYSEKHSSARLLGAPPGYVGYGEEGQILAQLHQKPYSVVLLDEIEKAHPEVLDVFLQLFEEGRLTDSLGRTVDGRHAVFIMTSNLLAERFQRTKKSVGFHSEETDDIPPKEMENELTRFFRPEFLNRIDEVILFKPLDIKTLNKIVRLRFDELCGRAAKQGLHLSGDDDALEKVVRDSINPSLGARPLMRALERLIARPLSRLLLAERSTSTEVFGAVQERAPLEVRFRLIDGEVVLQTIRSQTPPPFQQPLREPILDKI